MEQKIKIKLTSRRKEISDRLLQSLFDTVMGEESEVNTQELFADNSITPEEDVIEIDADDFEVIDDTEVAPNEAPLNEQETV